MLVCLVGITWLGILGATKDVANRETTLLKNCFGSCSKFSGILLHIFFLKTLPDICMLLEKRIVALSKLCHVICFLSFQLGKTSNVMVYIIIQSLMKTYCVSLSPPSPLWVFSSLFFNLFIWIPLSCYIHYSTIILDRWNSPVAFLRRERCGSHILLQDLLFLQDEVAGMNFRPSNKEEFNQLRKIFHLFKLTGQVKDTFFLELIRLPCFLVFNDVG